MNELDLPTRILNLAKDLKLDFYGDTIQQFFSSNSYNEKELSIVENFLISLKQAADISSINMMIKLSRIPTKAPKNFENFCFDTLNDKDKEKILSLKTLSFLQTGRNILFLGSPGTGKTHLALSIGMECCKKKHKAYFIKLEELKGKFKDAIDSGSTTTCLAKLGNFSCFIIDEIGHCTLNLQETRMFFQLIDKYYQKKTGSLIMTSNLNVNHWDEVFTVSKTLECALDRIFDESIVINLVGDSYRGRNKEFIKIKMNGSSRA